MGHQAPLLPSSFGSETRTFRHTPLLDPRRHIRLVTFDQPRADGSLCFRLQHYCLTNLFAHYALSYEWGTVEKQKTIYINGLPFFVYENLHLFLSQLQSHYTGGISVFVDSICIDQTNLTERNVQVQIMGQIYKQAKMVLAWLGSAADGSDLVFDYCDWEALDLAHGRTGKYGGVHGHGRNVSHASSQLPDPKSLRAVFQRTYWTRLWIIQELYLAQDVLFFCGTRMATRQHFEQFYHAIDRTFGSGSVYRALLKDSEAWSHVYSILITPKYHPQLLQSSLLEVLFQFRSAKCSDVRDKVYGLLGIVPERLSGHGIVVDYGVPPEILALRLVKTLNHCLDFREASLLLETLQLDPDLSRLFMNKELVTTYQEEFQDMWLRLEHRCMGSLKNKQSLLDILGAKADSWPEIGDRSKFYCAFSFSTTAIAKRFLTQCKVREDWMLLRKHCCVAPRETNVHDDLLWQVGTRLVIIRHLRANTATPETRTEDFSRAVIVDPYDKEAIIEACQYLRLLRPFTRQERKVLTELVNVNLSVWQEFSD